MSAQPTTDDRNGVPTDWPTAVLEAIQHLDTSSNDDTREEKAAFHLKAAHDTLARIDTDQAPRLVDNRVSDAVDRLETYDTAQAEAGMIAWTTLADLAPLAARVAREQRPLGEGETRPTVPVFYQVPRAAADRAIDRFEQFRDRRERGETEGELLPDSTKRISDFIYDEIREEHIFWVGDEPLADYAAGRVESLTIEPGAGGDQ